jgi:hypothetical protein
MAIQIQKYRSLSAAVEAFRTPCALEIPKADGVMRAAPGDWILIDEAGEQHCCAPDVFAETYQLVRSDEIAAEGVAESVISTEDTAAADAIAEASVRDCPIEDVLDVLIERLTGLTASDTTDRERVLALGKLEEARFWLNDRTRKRVSSARRQVA